MPRYYLDLPKDSSPRPWDPHLGPRSERADTRYFGPVFAEMEKTLRDPEIDIYLTWDVRRLPGYGDRVVAVVLGDEGGRIPRYVDRVRAVFKSYGTRPALGAGPVRNPGITGLLEVAQCGVRWLRWIPGGSAHAGHVVARRLRGRAVPPVSTIPLGTLNQLDLPVIPIEDRPVDVFFAGSIEHAPSMRAMFSPKLRARREMLGAARRLGRARPDLRIDVRVTPGFDASGAAPPREYSDALMAARVCLAPRGTSSETFRVFEGLRAGCVVVADRLPRHWFYEGAPVIQVDRWSTLEELAVFDRPAERVELHARARAWWRERCSEAAVGQFLAERLNALAARG